MTGGIASAIAISIALVALAAEHARRITYADLPAAVRQSFVHDGLSEAAFPAYVDRLAAETERRVAEGEREHLIYYALQSTRFTSRPRIEPAVSARRFVESLPPTDRERFLGDPAFVLVASRDELSGAAAPSAGRVPAARPGWPAAERARVTELLAAAVQPSPDPRLSSFRALAASADRSASIDALFADYVRVARFLYRKEFIAETPAQVASLYQTRPHSSDTQIEAGFAVHAGLGALHGLEPAARIARVLVVGPGLDLAPRTDLVDAVDPQCYQPFAVADALISLSMGSESSLRIHAVDVNPRVVEFVRAIGRAPATLHLFSGIAAPPDRPFSPDYAAYLQQFGRSIGDVFTASGPIASDPRYRHSIAVRPAIQRAITGERLDIVTERLADDAGFDLVVVTNVFPYFDDRQLALALTNIAAMLRPGGFLIHNESRPGLVDTAAAAKLPALHMRSVVIGGPCDRPFYDTVWLHRKN